MVDKTTMNEAASARCYIDGRKCTGARFSFCDDCKIAPGKRAGDSGSKIPRRGNSGTHSTQAERGLNSMKNILLTILEILRAIFDPCGASKRINELTAVENDKGK